YRHCTNQRNSNIQHKCLVKSKYSRQDYQCNGGGYHALFHQQNLPFCRNSALSARKTATPPGTIAVLLQSGIQSGRFEIRPQYSAPNQQYSAQMSRKKQILPPGLPMQRRRISCVVSSTKPAFLPELSSVRPQDRQTAGNDCCTPPERHPEWPV